MDYSLGPLVVAAEGEHYALLRHVLELAPDGIALEFGVGKGESTRLIAKRMPVIGFDSFQGLPEDWREGFPAGSFAQDLPPDVPGAYFVIGLYVDTMPELHYARAAGLIHIDCDLYSSTATVLEALWRERRHLTRGTYVVFDEWHGYDGAEAHEQRAWREFADRTGISWTVVGHGFQQWGIRLE